ncbi:MULTISPECIES: MurR/RpiR family transcriptional regulator [Brenneria]|uniref:MurR/RpiR family transcriptional regulator n=1 Tax=Brenneria nigrifluens DSM 30175 = ATCC 13028 TaxID=1121120 RepID=A0A2U1UVS0_9GAMM|nr:MULTISPECIES: MurR/RpiR family transcriptional regulator [Brenneria]EHD20168.1 transcriptional regulator, RpiR family [Brenneria sp. EniD312]PWC25738.1 MurR/RpiR family transcriptional regulator [Brenneria nigrifluens DSM 30175 = ATCC 13028]QCR03396.1 MurR/RpiR family transcriptional regulator [Brenneria nigrifluens DSM 30175 = ATCC 13028]
MDHLALCQQIKKQFESLPKQERLAAGFVLDHPQEVAVMSMREQARLAGIPPSTMTRLAKRLGLPGYDEIRAIFVAALRGQGHEYAPRVPALVEMKQRMGESSLVLDLANTTTAYIQNLCQESTLDAIVRAAKVLSAGRMIYCLGLRSSFPVAFHFAHVATYFQGNIHLIEGAGESGIMALMNNISPKDVLLVCSLSPYARRSVALSRYLAQQKVKVVAITDNASSPLARIASETILVKKQTTSFFDTLTPAFLVSELLVALLAATAKVDVQDLVNSTEEKLWAMGEWWSLN